MICDSVYDRLTISELSIHHCPRHFFLHPCTAESFLFQMCNACDTASLFRSTTKKAGFTVNIQSNQLFFIKKRLNHKQNQIKHKKSHVRCPAGSQEGGREKKGSRLEFAILYNLTAGEQHQPTRWAWPGKVLEETQEPVIPLGNTNQS